MQEPMKARSGKFNGLIYVLNINVFDDCVNFTTVEEVDCLEYSYDLQIVCPKRSLRPFNRLIT